MGSSATDLIEELQAAGIEIRINRTNLEFRGAASQELRLRLRELREEVWEELWVREGRRRQARAIERLSRGRQAFVERCIREGTYSEPKKPNP